MAEQAPERRVHAPAKVLLCGTFSVGKTTTLHHVLDSCDTAGVRAVLRPEPARDCPLPLDLGQHALTSTWLLGEMIRAESVLAAQANVDVVLCDGGPPDVLAHTPSIPGRETVFDLCRAWQATYDAVFWARPEPGHPVRPDALRVVDEGYRQEIDLAVASAFTALQVSPVELPHALSPRVAVMLDRALRVGP